MRPTDQKAARLNDPAPTRATTSATNVNHLADAWQPPTNLRALTVDQVLDLAGICRPKFYEEVRAGRLIARKCGRRTFVLVSDFEAYLNALPTLQLSEASA